MATILEGTTGARSRTSARLLGAPVGRIPSNGGPSSSRISPFPGSTDPYATFPRTSNRAIFTASNPQNRKHVVEPRRFPDHPRGGPHRAPRERVPTVGPVGDLEPFPDPAEHEGVFAHDVSRPDRESPDLLPGALPDHSLPAVHAHLLHVPAQRAGHHIGNPDRRPRGRVLLEPVMDLDDLDVVVVT